MFVVAVVFMYWKLSARLVAEQNIKRKKKKIKKEEEEEEKVNYLVYQAVVISNVRISYKNQTSREGKRYEKYVWVGQGDNLKV